MVALIKILQVILALSTLILIHELGHFLFARLFGIKVDKFFLFFDSQKFNIICCPNGFRITNAVHRVFDDNVIHNC